MSKRPKFPPHIQRAIDDLSNREDLSCLIEPILKDQPLVTGYKKPGMRVRFSVAGKVVGTNAAYKRSGSTAGRVGFYMTKEAKDFKHRVWSLAAHAADKAKWPVDYEGAIALTLKTFNCRQDVDSASKLEMDAMQGVFYINDKQVMKLTAEKAKDDKGPRVEIEVEMI